MKYVIRRSCTNKRIKNVSEYSLKELQKFADKLGLKKWKSLKKGTLCKKISKLMKSQSHLKYKNSNKKSKINNEINAQKTKRKVKFNENKNNLKEINYLPKKYYNTDYTKYALNSDPIKEYCSQTVLPKFNYQKNGKLHQLLNKDNLNQLRNNLKHGIINKNISNDDFAELEMCEEYLE